MAGKTVTKLVKAQKISQDLYMTVDLIDLSAFTVEAGGFAYAPTDLKKVKHVSFMSTYTYEWKYNTATGKVQIYNPAGGNSGQPSATANFPAQSFESFYQGTITANATKYLGLSGAEAATAAAAMPFVIPAAGFIRGIVCRLGTAPGGSVTYVLTVEKNGTDSTLVATFTGTGTTAEDLTAGHALAVAKGDLITLKAVAGTGSLAATLSASIIYEMTAGAVGAPSATHTHGPGGTDPAEVTGAVTTKVTVITIGTK
jgi:hypothetical protein